MATVLVIEDNPDMSLMVAMLLELNKPDLRVRVWGDHFEDILDPANFEGVDIAIIDVMLPGMDGRTICEWMAKHVPHVRRVIYSAIAGQVDSPTADAIISKTSDWKTLKIALGV